MSQINQAFIRAYQPKPPAAVPIVEPAVATLDANPEANAAENVARPSAHVATAATPTPPPVPQAERQERRPLSEFSAPADSHHEQFRPALEVDAFRWPLTIENLIATAAGELAPVVDQLIAEDDAGRSLTGVAGVGGSAGCSTVALCLARQLAAAGKSIALVDANFQKKNLADQLGIVVATGWEHVLAGEAPLNEALVHSIDDRIVLLPLAGSTHDPAELLGSIHASVSAGVLRYHYDMVLFDLGDATNQPQATAIATLIRQCRLDGCLAIGTADDAAQFGEWATGLGTTCLGLIENNAQQLAQVA